MEFTTLDARIPLQMCRPSPKQLYNSTPTPFHVHQSAYCLVYDKKFEERRKTKEGQM
jgi:hypothetical protein